MDLEESIKWSLTAAVPYLKTLYGSLPLKVLTGHALPFTEVGSYTDGWYLEHIQDVPTGVDYYKLVVFDLDDNRAASLKSATVFSIGGYVYQKSAADPPIYVAPLWEFRLQITGQRM